MAPIRFHVLFLACLVFLPGILRQPAVIADNWTQFLGPGGRGVSSDSVPKSWDASKNIAWTVRLPGSGSSSPILSGNKVIVTCYVTDADGGPQRQLLCFDKRSGKPLWTVDFPIDYREDGYRGFITEHGYASNTPATDGKHIYAFFGKGGVHCVTMDGEKVWSVDVGKSSSNRQWGSGSSVLLYRDTVIVNAADESRTLYCLSKADGSVLWKQQADMLELTYGTPRIVTSADGQDELVVGVPEEIWAMHPVTGKLKWYATSPATGNVSPSVIVDKDMIYGFGGYRSSGSIAVTAGGKGDVTESRVRWTARPSSYVATPLLRNGRFYWIDDRGIAYCTNANDGETVYRTRVTSLNAGGGRPVYASPVAIGEYVYYVTRRSGTIVVRPGDEFTVLAQNRFPDDNTDFNASPAVSKGRLYLRSDQALYCIAK